MTKKDLIKELKTTNSMLKACIHDMSDSGINSNNNIYGAGLIYEKSHIHNKIKDNESIIKELLK